MTPGHTPHTHLSYCTNIHPGEQWRDVFEQLQQHVPAVKQRICPDQAFGLGLRVSASSISTLKRTESRQAFKEWLNENHLYVFTVNAFPYGNFHATHVKANVYRPDWTTEERLQYTCDIAEFLAWLQPPDDFGTISTVPGTFRQWAGDQSVEVIVMRLLQCVAYCAALERSTGVRIQVALEPEPACMLETVDDILEFWTLSLLSKNALQQVQKQCQCTPFEAERLIHRHLGICYDICHAAVEFESPVDALKRMKAAGIPVAKLQLSSALRIPSVNTQSLSALTAFDEPVYLHQVVAKEYEFASRGRARLRRFNDIAMAVQDYHGCPAEWRVHFHVPVFLDALEHFGTTQQALQSVLKAHAHEPLAQHLEVETYTWDVLPETYRQVPVDEAIAREIQWVCHQLSSKSTTGISRQRHAHTP